MAKLVSYLSDGQSVKTEITQLRGESFAAAVARTTRMVKVQLGAGGQHFVQETLRKVG